MTNDMNEALDDAALAPDRVMPPDVRRRLRVRSSTRPTSARTHLVTVLSATAVAGVVMLAMLGGAQWRGGGSAVPAAASDPALAAQGGWTQEDIRKGNHFWTAAERYDAVANWASAESIRRCSDDRPGWEPLLTASVRGVTTVAFADGDERIFCELTADTVTVSKPFLADRGAAGASIDLVSPLGSVAGVVSTDVTQVLVSAGSDPDLADAAVISNGVFLRPNSVPAGSASFAVKVNGTLQTQRPSSGIQSHPAAAPDPGSPTNDLVACVQETDLPVADPGRWERGASSDIDGEHLQLWSYDRMLAICRTDASGAGSVRVVSGDDPTVTTEPELAATSDLGATQEIFYDFRPDSGGESSDTVALAGAGLPSGAASVEVTRPRSGLLSTRVVGDTFVLTGIRLNETGTGTDPSTLTVRDADGAALVSIDLADL
ncbi:hypothetical protein GCM10022223_17790 [Kineosporia mesophila]|uniref:Uncharacterized protein n=1 Tax=Kineosporia mesophila TaxID=566012 RepID=A0ABP6ZDA6_9ACTN